MLSSLDVRKASTAFVSRAPKTRAQASFLRVRHVRLSTVAALGFFRKRIATSGAVDDILAAVGDSERGCRTSRAQKARIDAAVGVLEGAGDDSDPVSKSLSATWKLLWTTEKVGFPAGSTAYSKSCLEQQRVLLYCRKPCSFCKTQAYSVHKQEMYIR